MNGSRISILAPGRFNVCLSGRFASGWAGGFTQALAREGFNIESGFAARNARGHWTAEFELTAVAANVDPFTIDFDALAAAPEEAAAARPVRLYRYALSRPAGDTRLMLSVDAPDQVGFLGALLRPLAMFSLFPVEMQIDTLRGVVHDRFQLRSTAGGSPSDSALQNVRQWLDRCTLPAGATAVPPVGTSVAEVTP